MITKPQKRPDLRKHVGVCMTCRHWQIDVRPGAISDLGGWLVAMRAIGEAHAEHIRDECPNAGGRLKWVSGEWVDAPLMDSGKPADGTLALEPTPRWWVAR
ncbi:hypothetical protein [Nocardioides jensenii]|uniref:hypothetical protein n=1 Tax=Nocardioides jensenii TaxID=1843 RepID=UPI000831A61D|nr:hypothetical protein [Nocardioides jensenii]